MTVIGRPPFNCQMAQLRASGVKVHAASPSLYQQWPVHICMSVYVCRQTCNPPPPSPSSLPNPGPFDPIHTSAFTLSLPVEQCSSSQKPLQPSSFCPPCYVSCLHEIGCSVVLLFLFCFFRSCVFSPNVTLAVVERIIAGNCFYSFF